MFVNKPAGFTLIELVIGIIVFSIALVMFTSLIVPQAIKSVDPIFQVRAAELGQSLINEIASKSFDEASDRTGGSNLCTTNCTASTDLGPDGVETRASFDDVDDYNGYSMPDGDGKFTNTLGGELALDGTSLYAGFIASVTVVYDPGMDGSVDADIGNTKRITVTVTTPNGEEINFSTFRSNF